MQSAEGNIGLITAVLRFASLVVEKCSGIFRRTPRPIRERSSTDRRTRTESRSLAIHQRLRDGLWLQYHKSTRAGEFDRLALDPYSRTRVYDALQAAARKFVYRERYSHAELSPEQTLNSALDAVWMNPQLVTPLEGAPACTFVIAAIAEYLCKQYDVSWRDRRSADRRSTPAERRSKAAGARS